MLVSEGQTRHVISEKQKPVSKDRRGWGGMGEEDVQEERGEETLELYS